MKNLAFVVSLIVIAIGNANAQSITVGTISGTVFCAGDAVPIPYEVTGSFTARNSFVAQISDAEGTFNSFTIAGSVRTPNAGVLTAVIPSGIPVGSKYRIRIVSSDPYVVSSNVSNSDISLGPAPNPSFAYTRDYNFIFALSGQDVQFNSSGSNVSVLWEFGADAIPPTSTEANPKVIFTQEGYKTVKLTAFGVGGCSKSASNQGLKNISIGSCFPRIPKDAAVDSVSDFYHGHKLSVIWVVPGGVLRGFRGETVFAEAGASIDLSEINTVYYMKAGSVLKDLWTGYIVYEDDASIAGLVRGMSRTYYCPDLEFDYSDAPPYKIKPASVARVTSSSVQVYPNPVAGRLTIEHTESLIREIIIRNALGAEQMFVQPEGLGKTSIDVSKLAAGLYFLDIIGEQGIETQKIVVQ